MYVWIGITLAGVVWWSAPQAIGQSDGVRPPNIVLLVADDLGYGELGCQGNPEIPTPHIDQMANQGVRCTQFYVTAPNCSPSRAGLFTGRIPTRFGYEMNPIGAKNEQPGIGLPPNERTLAEMLQDAGYTTGLIGKWHLGGSAEYHPQRHGFDYFFGFTHEGHYYVRPPYAEAMTMLRRKRLPAGHQGRYWASPHLLYSDHMGHHEPDYDANNPIVRNGQPVDERAYLTDALAREAVQFIETYRAAPFFLCVTFNAVHSPLQAKQSTMQRFAHIEDMHRRIFAAMLSDLDEAVGAITATLDRHGLADDTLVLFLSDNGGPTKELTSSNLPLRGGKGTMYEGGLRVPAIWRWDGAIPAARVYEHPLSSLDVMPTVAAACGIAPPEDLDGLDVLPQLRQSAEPIRSRDLYWRQGNRAAYRAGDWKIVSPYKSRAGGSEARVWELYNIRDDLEEQHDLAQQHPDVLHDLQDRWQALDAVMAPPLF
ncbi:MAG: N-acetylgalactosamine-4-sulfatase [Planctomycetota bacterium]|nr:MAG: N-acetylgalactosamine-4-sulfatase [Planctomycetota bacterium]